MYSIMAIDEELWLSLESQKSEISHLEKCSLKQSYTRMKKHTSYSMFLLSALFNRNCSCLNFTFFTDLASRQSLP